MAAGELTVEVVFAAGPHLVHQVSLRLPEGTTLADALRASRLLDGMAAHEADALKASVWDRLAPLDTPLRDGDRVELTRGLLVDPKEARRQRYRRDGVRNKAKTSGSPQR